MIRNYAGDVLPGQWQHTGARAFSPRCDETDRAATVAHLPDRIGNHWLMPAAQMAGLLGGNSWPSADTDPAGRIRLPRIATRTLGTGTGSVRAARNFAIATMRRWDTAERSQDIATVVSELLANALRHALPGAGDTRPRGPIRLGLLQLGRCVLCAVADPSKAPPAPRSPNSLAENGRGLHIICALSDQWGCTAPSEIGKVVWATFYLRRPAQLLPLAARDHLDGRDQCRRADPDRP